MTLWAGLYGFHSHHPLSFIHIYWELSLCQKLWVKVNACLSLAAYTSSLLSSTLKSALNKVPVWAINPELTLLILGRCSVHFYNFASLFCSSTCLWNLWFADSFCSYLIFTCHIQLSQKQLERPSSCCLWSWEILPAWPLCGTLGSGEWNLD